MARPYAVIGFTLFLVTALLFEFEIGVTVTAFAVFAAALVVCLIVGSVRRNRTLPVIFASAVVACALLVCENVTMEFHSPRRFLEKRGNLLKAFFLRLRGEVVVLVAGLRFACERFEQILLGLSTFKTFHNFIKYLSVCLL